MSLSKSVEYPIFNYNNESVIIKPGNQFVIKELKSRLHQMDIDAININSKSQLVDLYESSLKDDHNKFKIFDRLKKDTEIYASKLGISFNKRIPLSSENEKSQIERSKVINLKYNSNPYEENNEYEENNNIRKQEIKLKRPNKRTNNNNITNPFFSSEKNEQNNEYTYNEEEDNNKKYNNNFRNIQNNEINYNDFNNTGNNYYENNKKDDIEYNNKMYINEPEEEYIQYQENKKNNNENIKIKELDEESNFSLFSGLSNFKNTKQICCHILTGFIIIILALGILYLYRMFSETINGFFSNVFDTLIHPGDLISSGYNFIRNYWYIIPIILILIIIIISLIRKYKLRKRCEEIIKKLIEDLKNDEENRISEEDIYRRYVQGYGVSWKKFIKNYLPLLRKMRRKEPRLKNSSEKIDGKDVMFWDYCE